MEGALSEEVYKRLPSSIGISPEISSKSVDFPQPEGPTIAANSPEKRSK